MSIRNHYMTGIDAVKLCTYIKHELAGLAELSLGIGESYYNAGITGGLEGYFISVSVRFINKQGIQIGFGNRFFTRAEDWDNAGAELREMLLYEEPNQSPHEDSFDQ